MNGSGIQPTVELATTNGNNGFAYPYPVMNGFGGGYGNNGLFGGEGLWIIILIALLFGNGGWGGFGGFGGFGGGMYEFPWLLNGQQSIMNNTNDGFDTLHLSNQIEGTRDAINNVSTQLCDGFHGVTNQLCNSTASVTNALTNGFYNAEISANTRQMADMQQNFNNQIATLTGFNNLGSRFDDCCCENRLGIANLNSTILSENCADRALLQEVGRDIITSQNNGVQRIIDQLCADKIDAKNEKIADLQREILMKDLQASQVAQTADLRANNAVVANQLVSELRSCPIPAQPVYGNQPIFTCPANYNGCGCGLNTTSQFI